MLEGCHGLKSNMWPLESTLTGLIPKTKKPGKLWNLGGWFYDFGGGFHLKMDHAAPSKMHLLDILMLWSIIQNRNISDRSSGTRNPKQISIENDNLAGPFRSRVQFYTTSSRPYCYLARRVILVMFLLNWVYGIFAGTAFRIVQYGAEIPPFINVIPAIEI